jgi:hypothetical protein
MNLILLCHGELSDFGSFELAKDQEVQYRGNWGEPLSPPIAKALFQALIQNPNVTPEQIGKQINGYQQTDVLTGPKPVKPDIELWTTANPPCFLMDLGTREWRRLPPAPRTTLGRVVRALGAPLWLDLICCTELPGFAETSGVDPSLEVKRWDQVFA